MENSPLSTEDEEDNSSGKESTKKKKKAKGLGALLVKPEKPDQSDPAEDILHKLALTKRKGGRTETTIPLSELTLEGSTQAPEVSETEAPLEGLSPVEKQFVEREIVSSLDAADTEMQEPQAPGEKAPDSETGAIEIFRQKILTENQDSEQAFSETLKSLGAKPEADAGMRNESAPLAAEVSFRVDDESEESHRAAGTPPPARPPTFISGGDRPPERPAAPAPVRQAEYVPGYDANDVMSMALLSGIIGYLIGRRRGRIKTERKLAPVQKKLETQVKALEYDIAGKELEIRAAARRRTDARQETYETKQALRQEQQRKPAAEANQLHGKQSPERIGKMLMSNESRPSSAAALPAPEKAADRNVQVMSREALLEASDHIEVDNTTLRRVYESHLVSEQALRRLVSEYRSGGNLKEALSQELLEHEKDFERDPALRDAHGGQKTSGSRTQADSGLAGLLQHAGINNKAETESDRMLRAQQTHEAAEHARHQSRRKVLDFSLAGIIILLAALVVILLMNGR